MKLVREIYDKTKAILTRRAWQGYSPERKERMSEYTNKEIAEEIEYQRGMGRMDLSNMIVQLQARIAELKGAMEKIKQNSYPGLAVNEGVLLNRIYRISAKALAPKPCTLCDGSGGCM